ncbi:hypothetical protein VM1G_10462 [Cytospora mali]|uniref:DUF6546 domain-containing protein n=1 Tax=Cytospora mali TaxID=578113 RepID=A0A194VHX8_CYTMA|nr:hypothetical protein VM1G_10462 [Valsa mali]
MSFLYYADLPSELRKGIRDIAIKRLCLKTQSYWRDWTQPILEQRYPGQTDLATFACVDSEWRADVERVTFREIHLHECPHCAIWRGGELETFEAVMVGPRRSYVTNISINFTLCFANSIRRPRKAFVMASEGSAIQAPAVSKWCLEDGLSRVTRQLLNILGQWTPEEVHRSSIQVTLRLYFHELTSNPAIDKSVWPFGATKNRSLDGLPVVPFVDVYFLLQGDYSVINPSTLVGFYKRLHNLRKIRIHEGNWLHGSWSPADFVYFAGMLKDVAPGLKELYASIRLDRSRGEFPGAVTEYLRNLTFGLETAEIHDISDTPLFFAPYNVSPRDATYTLLPEWQKLQDLSLRGYSQALTDPEAMVDLDTLLISAGRAVAFMPNVETLYVNSACQIEVTRAWRNVAFCFKRDQSNVTRLQNVTTCVLWVTHQAPSKIAVDTWQDTIWQKWQVSLEINVKLKAEDDDWYSWEEALKRQAEATRKQAEASLEQAEAEASREQAEAEE